MKKVFMTLAIGLFCVSSLLITGCGNKKVDPGTNNPTENGGSKDEITTRGATTRKGTFVAFVKNSNKEVVDMEVTVKFYDESGTIVGTDSDYLEAVGRNQEAIVELSSVPSTFATYKIAVESTPTNKTTYFDKVESSHKDNGEEITVQLKNNAKETIEYVTIGVVYYQGTEVIGVDFDYEYDIAGGESVDIPVDYPTDKEHRELNFDRYEVLVNEAFSGN